MCEWGIEATQVKLANPRSSGRTHVPVDPCIAQIVQALNDAGIPTMASCCGHGKNFGRISLADGRDLLIVPFEQAQNLDASKGGEVDLFHLISHHEALLLAESELVGGYGSVDQWKATLSDVERQMLESYELEVQQAFDNIVFNTTGGLSGSERPRDSPTALAMISRLPRNEPDHVPAAIVTGGINCPNSGEANDE